MTRSTTWQRAANATGGGEAPLILLEINHATFAQPARLVNDNLDLVSGGNTYTAIAFDITLPDDLEGQMPRARLSLDNVGRELVAPLEASGGGEGATVRVMQVMRSTPHVIEWEATLDMRNVELSNMKVSAELGYENILAKPAVVVRYDPFTAAGLF